MAVSFLNPFKGFQSCSAQGTQHLLCPTKPRLVGSCKKLQSAADLFNQNYWPQMMVLCLPTLENTVDVTHVFQWNYADLGAASTLKAPPSLKDEKIFCSNHSREPECDFSIALRYPAGTGTWQIQSVPSCTGFRHHSHGRSRRKQGTSRLSVWTACSAGLSTGRNMKIQWNGDAWQHQQ